MSPEQADRYLYIWVIGLVIIGLILSVVFYLLISYFVPNDREKPEDKDDVDSEKGLGIKVVSTGEVASEKEQVKVVLKAPNPPPPPKVVEQDAPKVENTVKKASPVFNSNETITKSEMETESVKSEVEKPLTTIPVKPIVKNAPPSANSCPKSLSAELLTPSENPPGVQILPPVPVPILNIPPQPPIDPKKLSSESCDVSEKTPEVKKANLSVEKVEEPSAKRQGSSEVLEDSPAFNRLSAEKIVPEATTSTSSSAVSSDVSVVMPISSKRSEISHFNLIEAGRTPPNDHSMGSSLVKSSSRELFSARSAQLVPFDGRSSETNVSMTTPPPSKQ